jgi:aldose 1-epimerase
MDKFSIDESSSRFIDWDGERAVHMCAGGYEAVVIPDVGANLIELKHIPFGTQLLRKPAGIKELKQKPQVYGIPVLLPPNRIEDGTFSMGGKTYSFPVNEPARNNHIHGFLHSSVWDVKIHEDTPNDTAKTEYTFNADENTPFFAYFPHKFHISLTYTLSQTGLSQQVCIRNTGNEPMPMGLGFHTAFNTPFHPDSTEEDCIVKASVGKRWLLNERMLPTGEFAELDADEMKFRTSGTSPSEIIMDNHYTAEPLEIKGIKFNGAIIEDMSKRLRLVYGIGNKYIHWTIWNNGGHKGFVCPEPQTWAINAPNIGLPDEITGVTTIQPDETWCEICSIHVERF